MNFTRHIDSIVGIVLFPNAILRKAGLVYVIYATQGAIGFYFNVYNFCMLMKLCKFFTLPLMNYFLSKKFAKFCTPQAIENDL